MKKSVLLVICLIASSIIGFGQTYWHTTHPGSAGFMLMGYITIDGEENTSDQIEIGSFNVSSTNADTQPGVCVGADWSPGGDNPWEEDGHMMYMVTFYGTVGDVVTFKLYDHNSGEVLDLNCEVTATLSEDLGCIGCEYPSENLFVFAFTTPSTSQTYELPIPAYGAGNTGGYHLISSPVTEEITPSTGNGFVVGNFDLYYFNQACEDEWINYKAEDYEDNGTINEDFGKIVNGKGFLYASEGGTTLRFEGTPYSGDGIIPLVYSTANPSTEMRGWNLIGNPFPNENGATINMACYVMKADGTDLDPKGANTPIPAMNGVFVKATGTGQSAKFTPSNSDNPGNANVVVNILKDRGVAMDRAIVCFDNNGTLPKFMLNPDNTKVYIPQEDGNYAVVNSNIENSLPVNFKANEDGNYTLKIEVNDIRMEYLHLIDNMTGADVDLLVQPDYQFSATSHDYENRFTLVFKATTGVNEQTQQSFCFVNGRSLYFCEDVEGADFSLVDMTGRTLCNKVLKGNGVDLSSLSQGVYVVRLANGNEVKVQKVVVR